MTIVRVSVETVGEKTKIIFRAGEHHVKVHAIRRDKGFGVVNYLMTGSLCDADGKAAPLGLKIHPAPHIEEINSLSPENVAERVNAGLLAVVQRVLNAIEHEAADPFAAL